MTTLNRGAEVTHLGYPVYGRESSQTPTYGGENQKQNLKILRTCEFLP